MENQVSRRNKRYKAKRLFFTKKYSSKQICEMVGVTQVTMSKWIKRYGWKNPESAGFVRKVEALGLISPTFYNHLKSNNPPLFDELIIEAKQFIGANSSITVGQAESLKSLLHLTSLSDKSQYVFFTEVTGRPIEKISQLKYDEAEYLIEHLSVFDENKTFELTIKQVKKKF